MKVIRTDNYGKSGEAPGRDEQFVLINCTALEAQRYADEQNASQPENGPYYYRVVPDSYQLKEFMP